MGLAPISLSFSASFWGLSLKRFKCFIKMLMPNRRMQKSQNIAELGVGLLFLIVISFKN